MNGMAILKLTPSCKDYMWGGSRLRTDFGVQSDLDPLAEAWVLSCHPDGPSYLPDGTTLADYIAAHPGCLGTDCEKFEQFPILTKFIDAKSNLSIQVHPSNDYALKNEHQYGKTEMRWTSHCAPRRSSMISAGTLPSATISPSMPNAAILTAWQMKRALFLC